MGEAELSDDTLTPVNPPETKPKISQRPLDWIVGLSALSMVLIALSTAIVLFAGFVETDQDGMQLLNAAGLTFGGAAFAIMPFSIVAYWALRGRYHPWFVVALVMPWVVIGAMWITVGRFDPLPGILVIVVGALALLREFIGRKLNRA